MADVRLSRGNTTLLMILPEALADWKNPTAAELNAQYAYDTADDNLVFNVTCAFVDGYELGLEDPDSITERSVCDLADVETPTFDKYKGEFNTWRDEEPDGNGLFNMVRDLTLSPDRTIIFAQRIGVPSTTPFRVGDIVSLYWFTTDYPNDVVENNSSVKHKLNLNPAGKFLLNHEVVS